MSSENEPAKLLLPYLQRADELQKHEPLVAYYCRLYAMERGLRIPQSDRTKTTNSLLISLMNQLEKDKKSLKLGPEDSLHLEGFALNVFEKADKQDRAGRADFCNLNHMIHMHAFLEVRSFQRKELMERAPCLAMLKKSIHRGMSMISVIMITMLHRVLEYWNTAKTFYAASIFFEILNQFGVLPPDLEQKQKYAVWKAADIRKALKEGRKPVPGPPGGGEDLSIPPSTNGGSYDVGTSATAANVPEPDSEPSPRFQDNVNHYSTNVQPTPQFHDNVNEQHSADISPPAHHDFHPTPPVHRSESFTQSQPSAGYTSHDFHPPPPPNSSENATYSPPYHHQSFTQEPQQHFPQNYPNFQSYPSFTESSLPSVPTHYPSYYQGSESSYSSQTAPPPTASFPSTSQYSSSSRNGTFSEPAPTAVEKYHYDCNYQPTPDKIAEAHKAARFAVGALAFDDVSIAVEHLKKSLELLTNPSVGH
ncbi:hypothetical protein JRO89_XS15G0168300 [Xanthoceras sorbifolium]|uniref:Uncharacterized protein n=1 Tax=Xanthoceras sorbifolium TaxID=99658 RepID=A0ABQ8H2M6_9ROSI|nr:hypothetical protein JRO89_XS15G0168300 [Xanthoceras sorbifolium]